MGGVTPGRTSEHLGLPVLPSVRKAVEELRPDATGIYVAAHQAPAAIEEAIEAEVPLIVAVAEHIPLHDMLRIHSILKTQSASRLVGANSPGIISAVGKCRIGFQPLPCFSPGRIGIVAKSGTLSYEAVASTTRAGLGQSLCVGVGGDILPGTDLTEALSVLEDDEDTDAIALIGEIGGKSEIQAAEWIKNYHARTENPKPIVALIAGVNEARGRIMGHAGAFTLLGEPDASTKIEALKAAGVTMVHHPSKFGDALKARLQARVGGAQQSYKGAKGVAQQRGLHTATRPPRHSLAQRPSTIRSSQQRRSIYLAEDRCFDLLRQESGINAGEYSGKGERRYLAIGIDRSKRSPCIIASPSIDPNSMQQHIRRFPFDYRAGVKGLEVDRIASHLGVSWSTVESLREVIKGLVSLFYSKEAFLLETSIVERLGGVKIVNANFGFDDAAFRSNRRQEDIQALRDTGGEDPAELEAEANGIVYIKLEGDGKIGTLVNGAGLAMNTVDALAEAGGRAANFLDTGGKATSETVKKSFEVILRDPRVNVIFVNIFGGLTLGDMIARGVILAFKETAINVPVVVRIRGTNEEEGQRIIAESGLPLFAFDDFDEAATKAIELSQR